MRVTYFSLLILSVAFFVFSCAMFIMVKNDKLSEALFVPPFDNSDAIDEYISHYKSYTLITGYASALLFLFCFIVHIRTLIKLKSTTMKVLSIIGLACTSFIIFWDALMISAPGHISFDEVFPAWFIYGLFILALSIVGIIQAFRQIRKQIRFQEKTITQI